MEIIVANLGAFMELLMIQLYFGLVWGERIVFRKFSIFLFLWNAVMVTLVNLKMLPGFVILSSYVWIVVYAHFHNLRKYKENIVKFLVLIIISVITEIITLTIVNIIRLNLQLWGIGYLSTCFLNLIFSIFFCCIEKKRKFLAGLNSIYNKIFLILNLCIFIIIFIYIDVCFSHELRIVYDLFIFTLFGLIMIYVVKFQNVNYELMQKNLEEKLNDFYGNVYEELLSDVRRRQHDYKNHFIAIYNSHQKATSIDELVDIQTNYLSDLIEEGKFDSILTKCNDPVVAGFLYHKACYCQDNNIKFEFNLIFEGLKCELKKYELIEILGNFIDNSIEYVTTYSSRIIKVELLENEHNIIVSVSNPSEYFGQEKIKDIFELGRTSKGSGRGIGLSRVLQICNKNGLEIQVENVMENENWIKFTVIIPNKEDAS